MKKNIYLLGVMMLGGAMFSSCNDMLEKDPLDSFTNSPTFWNNPSSVEGYAAEFYNLFTGYGNSGGSGLFYFQSLSDDQAGAGFKNWKYVNVPSEDANWTSTYDEIRHANEMINSLNTMASEMDPETKNHWLGVARLMRGWQHFDLVRKYGDCLWADHVLTTEDPLLYSARTDRDEVMDLVLEDLQFACNNINDVSSQTTWSRDMARALTADICLWEGTFRKYRTAEENGKGPDLAGAEKYLEYCVEVCEPLIGKYKTSDNYQAIYNSISLSGNGEVIFYKEYKQDVLEHSTIDYTCSSTQQDGMTKDAFDSYLFLDGQLKANTTIDTSDDMAVVAKSDNDGANHLNIRNMLEKRDKRLIQTIDTVLCYTGSGWPRVGGGMAMTASTGYTVSKYDNVTINAAYRQQTSSNYTSCPLFWGAVVRLNYAEAKCELGTLTQDDLDRTVNELKQRAGLPTITLGVNLNDPKMTAAGVTDPLLWEIRRERRCELMFDNDFRYWDLIRWHMLDKLDTTDPKNLDTTLGAEVSVGLSVEGVAYDGAVKPDANGNGQYIDAYNVGGTDYDRVFDPKHYLYPIPSGEITLNKLLGQNLGWK